MEGLPVLTDAFVLQMELAEARVLALRRALDDSLKVYQGEQAAVRRANGTNMRRPLTVIFRSKNAALFDISVRFQLQFSTEP